MTIEDTAPADDTAPTGGTAKRGPLSADERLAAAKQRAAKATARVQKLRTLVNAETRKQDTRRKIILGGLLIDGAGKDEKFARVINVLMKRIDRDHDRVPFDGWTIPSTADQAEMPLASDAAAPVQNEHNAAPEEILALA